MIRKHFTWVCWLSPRMILYAMIEKNNGSHAVRWILFSNISSLLPNFSPISICISYRKYCFIDVAHQTIMISPCPILCGMTIKIMETMMNVVFENFFVTFKFFFHIYLCSLWKIPLCRCCTSNHDDEVYMVWSANIYHI